MLVLLLLEQNQERSCSCDTVVRKAAHGGAHPLHRVFTRDLRADPHLLIGLSFESSPLEARGEVCNVVEIRLGRGGNAPGHFAGGHR